MRAFLAGSTALTGLLVANAADAASAQWLGTTSSNWFAGSNWSTGTAPVAADNVTIDTTSPNQAALTTGGAASANQIFIGSTTAGNLWIQNTSTLTTSAGTIGFFQNGVGGVSLVGAGTTWNNAGNLDIGYAGTGVLGIGAGSTVTVGSATLGTQAGGSGTVMIIGSGASWSSSGDVDIGKAGTGTLTISNGASASALDNFVGDNGTGSVTVTGAGSSWTTTQSLLLGTDGTASLRVLQGASVTAAFTTLGGNTGFGGLPPSQGTAVVDGAGSLLNAGSLEVGAGGIGQLTVSNGGHLQTSGSPTSIGFAQTGRGTVTVDGAGSSWLSTVNIRFGESGTGALNVTNGGALSGTALYLGYATGGNGTAVIDGAGSTLSMTGLFVGNAGTGALTISNGAVATIGSVGMVTAGANAGSSGSITVDGSGSRLNVNGNIGIVIGSSGNGTLTISRGGAVSDFNGEIGSSAGSTGAVTVDGAGSSWANSSTIYVGDSGTGSLTISNGAAVSSVFGAVGNAAGSSGTLTVSGAGSSWLNSQTLLLGLQGSGALNVLNGGQVTISGAQVGDLGTGIGSVLVDGAGSALTNNGDLYVGNAGRGTLTIARGGSFTNTGNLYLAFSATGTGVLNIGAAPGAAPVAPGTLSASSVQFGAGTGVINFNHTSASYLFSPDIIGNGAVHQLSGNTLLTGTNSYTGATTVDGGTLSVNGAITNSAITVNAGGALGGNGSVADVTVNGGALSPGNSIGTLTVSGNLVLTTAASYIVQVSGASADKTVVVGAAQLAGTLNVAPLSHVNATTTYTILTASSLSGTFGPVALSNPAMARNPRVSYVGGSVLLTLDPGLLSPVLPTTATINQKNVAAGIDAAVIAGANPTGGFNALFNASGTNLGNALTQASGETATGTLQNTFSAMNHFLNVLLDPFIDNRADPATADGGALTYADEARAARAKTDAFAMFTKAPMTAAQRWNVWAAGYGGSQTTDGNAVVGSNAAASRIAGTAAGADYLLSPHTLAGFALGGGGTSFSIANGLGSGRSDLFQAGAYVRHGFGDAYVAGALAYGWQDVTTNRTVTIAGLDQLQARFNANTLSGRVEGGYRFATPWMGLTPYAAMQSTSFFLPNYAERALSGASTFALGYAARDVTDTRSELGLRADRSYALETAILTLRGRLAWAHDYNPDRTISAAFQTLPGASFVVNGAAQAHDSALTTASAEMRWANGWSAAASFEGEFSSVTQSYAGKGGFRYAW